MEVFFYNNGERTTQRVQTALDNKRGIQNATEATKMNWREGCLSPVNQPGVIHSDALCCTLTTACPLASFLFSVVAAAESGTRENGAEATEVDKGNGRQLRCYLGTDVFIAGFLLLVGCRSTFRFWLKAAVHEISQKPQKQ